LVLLDLVPLVRAIDRRAQARTNRHAEGHHNHQVLLVLTLDLPERRRHEHEPRIPIEALMMREADVALLARRLALFVAENDGRLLAQLDPGTLWRLGALLRGLLLFGRCGFALLILLGGLRQRCARRNGERAGGHSEGACAPRQPPD